ncbi:hypothetical protein [Arthrobacter sp. UYCo732]|uniref:hypothetical protein n=1 Tax=Arthrobacter sp. UYCo732 TaxID=3156336 RepID=UPI00339787B2
MTSGISGGPFFVPEPDVGWGRCGLKSWSVACLGRFAGFLAVVQAGRSLSWGWISIFRPFFAVVHRPISGQPPQALPKLARPFALTGRVIFAGHVTVFAASSMVKSSTVNPSGTARPSGIGLITGVCPAA